MKTVISRLRLPEELYENVRAEAKRRKTTLSETFRVLIACGFDTLSPLPADTRQAIADTWEKLGPAPEVDYHKL